MKRLFILETLNWTNDQICELCEIKSRQVKFVPANKFNQQIPDGKMWIPNANTTGILYCN